MAIVDRHGDHHDRSHPILAPHGRRGRAGYPWPCLLGTSCRHDRAAGRAGLRQRAAVCSAARRITAPPRRAAWRRNCRGQEGAATCAGGHAHGRLRARPLASSELELNGLRRCAAESVETIGGRRRGRCRRTTGGRMAVHRSVRQLVVPTHPLCRSRQWTRATNCPDPFRRHF